VTIGKRVYWVIVLVAVMALAGAAVTLTAHFTSASGNTPTPAVQTCDEQDDGDDAIENAADEADDDVIEEECGDQNEADDAIESAKGPDTDNIQEQSGDQNEADDSAE